MDLRLTPNTMPTAVRPTLAPRISSSQVTGGGDAGFSGALKSALSSVSAAQNESGRLQREVQLENPKVSLEDTMVAIQKAQIGQLKATPTETHRQEASSYMNSMQF